MGGGFVGGRGQRGALHQLFCSQTLSRSETGKKKNTLSPPRQVVLGDSARQRIVPAFSGASPSQVLRGEVWERRAPVKREKETQRRREVYLTVTGDGLTADQW